MDVNRIKIGKLHNAELESIERFEKKLFILFLEFYYLFKHTWFLG